MHNKDDNFEDSFLALKELYRSERVFTLQPERVILDERFRNLDSDMQQLRHLSESARIGELQKHGRLIAEFIALLEEAGKIHIYSNYRANQ